MKPPVRPAARNLQRWKASKGMTGQGTPPIIIIRKKRGHGGHHGGAWKVAYADFVTAMMALFIVLWLMNSSEKIRKAISAYFQDPSGTGAHSGSATAGTGETVNVSNDNMDDLKEQLEQAMKKSPGIRKIEGLRPDERHRRRTSRGTLENEKGMFFESASPVPTGVGNEMILRLAQQLRQLPNDVLIEGHTDSHPFGGRPITPIGSSPPIAPTPPAGSWKRLVCGLDK